MNVLITGARAPIAADVAKSLAVSGHKVWLADSVRTPVGGGSPFVEGVLRLPSPRTSFPAFVEALRDLCARQQIEAVVPTSEEVFWLAAAMPQLPPHVQVRTSALPVLAQLHHKGTFARLATWLGYGLPENHELAESSQLQKLSDPTQYVFKPVYSRFATRTLIAPTARQLRAVTPTRAQPWLAQTRAHGRELCAYNVAEGGRLLLHVAYEPRFRIGVGASAYFFPVQHDALRVMSERIIQATGFTGQISFDVIDTADGLVALECNPRGTSGVHLAVQQPAALAAALFGQPASLPAPFVAEPRMLLLPLLSHYPGAVLRANSRAQLAAAKDALRDSGISFAAQAVAFAEMAARAVRARCSIPAVSTADIEWNGEPIHG